MKRLMLPVLALLAMCYIAGASAASAADTSKAVASPVTMATAAPAPAAKHFDPDEATKEWMAQIPADAKTKSDAYFEGGYWLQLWDFVVGLLVAWLMLGTGISQRMRDFNEKLVKVRFIQTAFYVIEYLLFTTVVTLPWTIYEGYFREHQYGMSNQDLGAFLGDQAKGLALGLIFGTILLTIIYAVIRKTPRTWWIWGAVIGIAFTIIGVAIGPTYLEPVFNKFYPLKEGVQKEQILSLARANGIPATDVYEFDASKQTKRMSAHVSGLGGTTQISLNDNLVNRGSPEEVQAVLGHEMGHYVLHHVFHGIVEISVLVILGFAFVKWSFEKLRTRYAAGWGIRDVGDVAGLPLLAALFSVYFFVLTPVQNTLTRLQEAEADVFGLNAARQPDGFAQAAIHLAEYRKMEPGTVEEWLFYDHPSGWHRIHRAMVWKAEHLNDADIAAYDAAHPTIAMPPEPKTDAAPGK